MKAEIIQWAHDNWLALALAVLLIVGLASVLCPRPVPFEIAVEIAVLEDYPMPVATVTWTEQPSTICYQVQSQMFDAEWSTMGITKDREIQTLLPPGATRFRVRAWGLEGFGRWTTPTDLIYFFPEPIAEPEYESSLFDEAMLLPWDPDQMEPGPYDGIQRDCVLRF